MAVDTRRTDVNVDGVVSGVGFRARPGQCGEQDHDNDCELLHGILISSLAYTLSKRRWRQKMGKSSPFKPRLAILYGPAANTAARPRARAKRDVAGNVA